MLKRISLSNVPSKWTVCCQYFIKALWLNLRLSAAFHLCVYQIHTPGVSVCPIFTSDLQVYYHSVACGWLNYAGKTHTDSHQVFIMVIEGVLPLKKSLGVQGYNFTELFETFLWNERKLFEEQTERWVRSLYFLPVFIIMFVLGIGRQSRRMADPCFPLDPVQFLTGCHVESLQDHSHAKEPKRDCWRLAAWLSAVSTTTPEEKEASGSSYV